MNARPVLQDRDEADHRDLRLKLATLGYLILASIPLSAQESAPTLVRGDLTLDASLSIESRDIDNLFRSDINAQSARVTVLAPSLLMSVQPSEHRLELNYEGEIARYRGFSADDFEDHLIDLGAYLSIGNRMNFDLIATHEEDHEDRGTGLTQGFDFTDSGAVPEPDRFEADEQLARLRIGTDGARVSFEIETGNRKMRYNNNLERTEAFDRVRQHGQLIVRLSVGSNTQLQLITRTSDIDYDLLRTSGRERDSREARSLLGVRWEASGKTTGTVRIGQTEKEYEDLERPAYSETSWEVDVRWSPRTYSHIDIGTERFPSESTTLTGDVIDNERYTLSWTHEWTDRIETVIQTESVDQEYRDTTEGRIQDLRRWSIVARYAMRDWLTWEAGVEDLAQDSNLDRFNFDAKVVRIGARIFF